MNSKLRPGRCWSCGKPTLRVGNDPEHVIQAALGGGLETDKFCTPCNRELGKRIDQPFLEDWFLAIARAEAGLRTKRSRRRPPPNPKQEAEMADGRSITIDVRDGWQPRLHPRVDWKENAVRIEAGSQEDAERVLEDIRAKLHKQGRTFEIDSEWQTVEIKHPEVRAKAQVSKTIWLRAGAKITLGALSKVMPVSWLDSANAKQLQGWLWDDWPKTLDGKNKAMALPDQVPPEIAEVCPPPQHLVALIPGDEPGKGVMRIILFGKLTIAVGVDGAGTKLPEIAWLLDPVAEKLEETTWRALVRAAALRTVQAQL